MFGCRQSHIFPSSGAANPYPCAINVGGLRRGKVLDVNMTLHNITHGSSNDIDVLLVGPRGQNPVVMSDVRGSAAGVSNVTPILDDEATFTMDGIVPANGTFKPTNVDAFFEGDVFPAPAPLISGKSTLSVFDGTNPNGNWNLFLQDNLGRGPDGGRLAPSDQGQGQEVGAQRSLSCRVLRVLFIVRGAFPPTKDEPYSRCTAYP